MSNLLFGGALSVVLMASAGTAQCLVPDQGSVHDTIESGVLLIDAPAAPRKAADERGHSYATAVQILASSWWSNEYSTLARKVHAASPEPLATKWALAGPGHETVWIALRTSNHRDIYLYIDLPDFVLGASRRGGEGVLNITRIVMYDDNMDGNPEAYWAGPSSEKPHLRQDFSTADRQGYGPASQLIRMWNTSIGFAVNHFLYGIDSSLPRRR